MADMQRRHVTPLSCGHWQQRIAEFRQAQYSSVMSTMSTMSTMSIFSIFSIKSISLPETRKLFVDQQVSQVGYGTSSECVRELIRKDLESRNLRGMLLAGAASAPQAPSDAAFFAALRERAQKKARR